MKIVFVPKGQDWLHIYNYLEKNSNK